MPVPATVSNQQLENSITELAAHINAATHLELLVRSYRRVERTEEESRVANLQHARRYLRY